jgi:hypothetical protein
MGNRRGSVLASLLLITTFVACSSEPEAETPPSQPVQSAANCGRLTTPCETGGACEGAPDCKSSACSEGKCQDVIPPDGQQNNGETDVDCGGTKAAACDDGKKCAIASDCKSSVCTGATCQAPSPTDGVKNGDETGKDCGGSKAPKCPAGEGCASTADCADLKCDDATKKCSTPGHDDGIKNGDETGIDCGGPTATKKCAPGEGCISDGDCDNTRCDTTGAKTCKPPAKDDGLKNGSETDIDCGGGAPTNAPKCAVGRGCAAPSDCATDGCAYDKKCAVARSCAPHEGGDTCGKGEVGQAGAAHESCCASVTLPGANIRVDKYEITAGRMREFIARTGGNVRAWVDANRVATAQIADASLQYLPEGDKTPTRNIMRCDEKGLNCSSQSMEFGVLNHLGNAVFHPDRPCPNCGQGCYIGKEADGGYGHPTYWFDDITQKNEFGAEKREFDRQTLDTKSLNCVTQVLLAAFCAWDGGRLPTQAELGGASGAWGSAKYPWGTTEFYDTVAGAPAGERKQYSWTPDADPNDNQANFDQAAFFIHAVTDLGAGPVQNPYAAQYNITNWNPFASSPYMPEIRYAWPVLPYAKWGQTDQAYAAAAPGRMYNDYRQLGANAGEGVYDLGANMIEITATQKACTDDNQCDAPLGACVNSKCQDKASHDNLPTFQWVGGSFEGHSPNNRGGYDKNLLTKYGKAGGRCVRPL